MQNATTFSPATHLTFETVSKELNRLMALFASHDLKIMICDLGGVVHCDSAGLAFLIEVKRLCQTKKTRLLIQNMSQSMQDLATFCGVAHLFLGEVVDDKP